MQEPDSSLASKEVRGLPDVLSKFFLTCLMNDFHGDIGDNCFMI